jgi:hypothetical protein
MRISPVIPAILVSALAAVAACSLPLEGLSPEGAGGSGGKASVTSAGGAQVTGTATSSTSTGGAPCATKSECMADSDCVAYECTQGQCVKTSVNEGMTIQDPGGNCVKTVCLSGVLETQPDDGDADDDKDPCTVDACVGMTTTHEPAGEGASCGEPGKHCYGGQCLECATAGDCALNSCNSSAQCTNGKCELQPKTDGTACMFGACVDGNCCTGINKACGSTCCGDSKFCSSGVCCPALIASCKGVCCGLGEHCTGTGCKFF